MDIISSQRDNYEVIRNNDKSSDNKEECTDKTQRDFNTMPLSLGEIPTTHLNIKVVIILLSTNVQKLYN